MRLIVREVLCSNPGPDKNFEKEIHSWPIPWGSGSESFCSERSSLAWSLYEANMLREVNPCSNPGPDK